MKHYFTEEQIAELRSSPYVKSVGREKIRYSEVFIQEFIELRNRGKKMKEISQFLGFDTALLGYQRMNGLAYRLKDYETFEAYLAAQAPKNPVEGMTDKQLIDYYRHLCELQAQELRFLKKVAGLPNGGKINEPDTTPICLN